MSLYLKKMEKKKRKEKSLPEGIPSRVKPGLAKAQDIKETPSYASCFGVLTLEAALILPMLAAFFVSILFLFRILQVQLEVKASLDVAGRLTAVYQKEDTSEAVGLLLAKGIFRKELAKKEQAKNYIQGGVAGVSLLLSDISKEDVSLRAVYQISFPIKQFFIPDLQIIQKSVCRKWTGYHYIDIENQDNEWVYITETGSVYHTTKECSHLNLSIQMVLYPEVFYKRNENGEKYRMCVKCAEKDADIKTVYITNQGDCYHYDINCSGMKRTIMMVRRSEVRDYRACSKCGGR